MKMYHLVEAESLWALSQKGAVNLPQVKTLQDKLRAAGFDPGASDGWYGKKTAAAVRAYQEANGLTVDGDAGPQTLGSLRMAGANNTPPRETPPEETPPAPAPRQPASEPADSPAPTRREPAQTTTREPAQTTTREPEQTTTSDKPLGRLADGYNNNRAMANFIASASGTARSNDVPILKLARKVEYPRTEIGEYVMFKLFFNPEGFREAGLSAQANMFQLLNDGDVEGAIDIFMQENPGQERPSRYTFYSGLDEGFGKRFLMQLHRQVVRNFELDERLTYTYTIIDGMNRDISYYSADIIGESLLNISTLAGL